MLVAVITRSDNGKVSNDPGARLPARDEDESEKMGNSRLYSRE